MNKKEFSLVNFAVNKIAIKYEIGAKEVYELLKQFDAINYLIEFYDSIHTQGGDYIVGNIDEFLQHRGFAGFDSISWHEYKNQCPRDSADKISTRLWG